MTPELLDQIAQDFANHQQSLRVKKLMFAAVKGFWENDQATLDQHQFPDLLRAARDQFSGTEQLEGCLLQIVDTLNKKTEYVMIADLICQQLRSLYPSVATHQTEAPSWFDLRCQIVKSMNPLRVKILIFSALYHSFTSSEADWVSLKMHSLDDLLKQFLSRHPHPPEMLAVLNSTALSLEPIAEHTAIAKTLLPALQSWQARVPFGRQDASEMTILAALETDETEVGTAGNLAKDQKTSPFLANISGAQANGS
jgi:hypothetical protein